MDHGIRFYAGTHAHSPMWHRYRATRHLLMRRAGIIVESRPLDYRAHDVGLPDGAVEARYVPQEKGIDLRSGLDVVRLARALQLDVAVIFSQDQDLGEVVSEVSETARDTNRWIKVVPAFPAGPVATAQRGVDGVEWDRMDQTFCDACLDLRNYRPRNSD